MSDFEDPTQLARCIKSDCQGYRAGNTPLCATHLREQEKAAGASSIVEPELEARAKAAGERVMRETVVLMDPDVNGAINVHAGGAPPNQITGCSVVPDLSHLEPQWNGTEWVLRPKRAEVDMAKVMDLIRRLMAELGMD